MSSKLKTAIILVSIVRNWWVGFLIRLYLIPEENLTKLKLRSGHIIFVRPKSGDLNEVITVLSGKEYNVNELLRTGSPTIVDVGAHIGTFTLLTKSLNSESRIFAFEPEPTNYSLFEKNMSANKFKSVTIFNQAVSNKSGSTRIKGEAGLMNYASIGNKEGNKINTVTLDQLVEKSKIIEIDILKIDCEGSELKVLQGFTKIKMCKNVFVETHELVEKGITDKVIKLLKSRGFKPEKTKVKEEFGTHVLHFTR